MKSRVITALFFTCCACATHTQARTVFASPKGKKCHTDYCRQSGDPAAVTFAWGVLNSKLPLRCACQTNGRRKK